MATFLQKLREVGKRNSAADAKKLQAAHDTLVEAGAVCSAAAIGEALRTDDSLDARRQAIGNAARALFADPSAPYDSPYCYVRDLFDTDVVVEVEGEIYQIPYTVDADGAVTLGEPIEVDIAYIPSDESSEISERKIPATARFKKSKLAKKDAVIETKPLKKDKDAVIETVAEAATDLNGEYLQLREGAVSSDGSAVIKVIQSGWGSSGYYSPEVLKRDGPKAFTKGLQMFWNHQTAVEESQRPEGDLDDLASKLTADAAWQEAGPDGPGLYAPVEVYPAYRDSINALAADIGVSIRASGVAKEGKAEGRSGPIIERIAAAKSIDYVTKPGAGGKILQLFEAARTRTPKPIQETTPMEKTADVQLTERVALLETQNAELVRSNLLSEARQFISSQLAVKALALPAASQQRVARDLNSQAAPIKEGRVDIAALETRITEAVSAEATYIAAITGAGQVKGLGATEIAADSKSIAEAEASLAVSFQELGLSEAGAKNAARGR